MEWEILGDVCNNLSNLTKLHSSSSRTEEPIERFSQRFSLRFSYCSYTFHHHYVNQRQYHHRYITTTSPLHHDALAERVVQNARVYINASRETLHLTLCQGLCSCWTINGCDSIHSRRFEHDQTYFVHELWVVSLLLLPSCNTLFKRQKKMFFDSIFCLLWHELWDA